MLNKNFKQVFCFLIIFIDLLFILGVGLGESLKKIPDLNDVMRTKMILKQKIEISGRIFEICIDQCEKRITIKGYVDDWNEIEKIENYLKHRCPFDYQIICEIDITG